MATYFKSGLRDRIARFSSFLCVIVLHTFHRRHYCRRRHLPCCHFRHYRLFIAPRAPLCECFIGRPLQKDHRQRFIAGKTLCRRPRKAMGSDRWCHWQHDPCPRTKCENEMRRRKVKLNDIFAAAVVYVLILWKSLANFSLTFPFAAHSTEVLIMKNWPFILNMQRVFTGTVRRPISEIGIG